MNTCRSTFYELRRISSISKYLTIVATKTIVCSLALSRLGYCNSILSGSSKWLIKTAEGSKCSCEDYTKDAKTEHTTHLLRMLHWLAMYSRIAYKIDSICHTSFTTAYPKYLSELLTVYTPARTLRS